MFIDAKIVFSQICRDVKNAVFEKNMAVFVFALFMLERGKQKKRKNTDGKLQKMPGKSVFWGAFMKYEKIENLFFSKLPNTICV